MANTEFFARHGLQVAPNTRFRVSTGNTGQRPSPAANGDIRFNSDLGVYEGYYSANSTWASLGTAALPSSVTFATDVTVGNSTVNVYSNSTYLKVGDTSQNVVINTSSLSVTNSTISTVLSQGTLSLGANAVINTTGWGIGNSTVSIVANSTVLSVGNTTINSTASKWGNSTVFASANSTVYSGTALLANNSAYLGGIIASQYAFSNQITGVTVGGSNTHVQYNLSGALGGSAGFTFNFNSNTMSVSNALSVGNATVFATVNSSIYSGQALTANNSTNLNGQAAAYYLNYGNMNAGTVGSGGLSSGTNYVCNIMTATTYLYSSGNIYAVGDVYASYSDKRLKSSVFALRGALDIIENINGYTYYQNELGDEVTGLRRPGRQVGLIAQEVERVLPEAVAIAGFDVDEDGRSKSGEDYLTISYEKLVPVLVEAIKELRQEIRMLKGQ